MSHHYKYFQQTNQAKTSLTFHKRLQIIRDRSIEDHPPADESTGTEQSSQH